MYCSHRFHTTFICSQGNAWFVLAMLVVKNICRFIYRYTANNKKVYYEHPYCLMVTTHTFHSLSLKHVLSYWSTYTPDELAVRVYIYIIYNITIYLCTETQHHCLLTGGAIKIKSSSFWFWDPAQYYLYCYSDNSEAISVIIFIIS